MEKFSIDEMGTTNTYWGVCGFTSTFYAMHMLGGLGIKKELKTAKIPTRVLAEIKMYLMMLKADEKTDLLNDITNFTRAFGKEHQFFSIDNYIKLINSIASKTEKEIIMNTKYGIAMPPHAVVDYLKRAFGINTKAIKVNSSMDLKRLEGIVGVSNGKIKKYEGLCHYVFIHKGIIYTWMKQFKTLTEAAQYAGETWKLCYHIKV